MSIVRAPQRVVRTALGADKDYVSRSVIALEADPGCVLVLGGEAWTSSALANALRDYARKGRRNFLVGDCDWRADGREVWSGDIYLGLCDAEADAQRIVAALRSIGPGAVSAPQSAAHPREDLDPATVLGDLL